MNESFDQHAGHSPLPSTGSRQAAHSGGRARSSAVRNTAPAAAAARLTREGNAMVPKSDMPQRYRSAMLLSSPQRGPPDHAPKSHDFRSGPAAAAPPARRRFGAGHVPAR